MKTLTIGSLGILLVLLGGGRAGGPLPEPAADQGRPPDPASAVAEDLTPADLDGVLQQYCQTCHNDRRLRGNMSLEGFEITDASAHAELAEKMVTKLRAGMMPPKGARRPSADTLLALVETLEHTLDDHAARHPDPGGRTFQRLNRAEYAASIEDILDLDIDAADFLPLDTKSANFDNIADVQTLSPTLMDAYLRAADEISRLAVGVPDAGATSITYTNSGYVSQWERIPGAPLGTRGGISVVNNFPADGEYVFRMWMEHTTMGEMFGRITPGEQMDISIDGQRVALLNVDRWLSTSDPNGASMETGPIFVRSGPHRVSAAFIQLFDGPVEDLTSPHDWSLVDRQVGVTGYGITALAHLKDLVVLGPYDPSGVSETPTRKIIFSCRPTATSEARACAESIVRRLATKAFRRPESASALESLMALYDGAASREGFEAGVRVALQGILSMPDFVFRLEEVPNGAVPGQVYPVADIDLASRLSFFLWGSPPDEELVRLALQGKLADEATLVQQARRMLADPRAEALGTRFASQWLRLEDLEKLHPDRLQYPDYYEQLGDAMLRETELFFNNIVQEDRSIFDLFTADYTFVNEPLAKHYGIRGVVGEEFRRVTYPDDTRRGLLGQGSILALTSHADRTSPVLRGKWVMEVLMGTPPPPPPPGVPALEETSGTKDGHELTTRERMEMHRASPSCNSCHSLIDPIGLALDNFDVTGKWRIRENGVELDTRGEFYDGTMIASPAELRRALLKRPEPLIRTFTQNLMAYALGRRVEYYDMPTVRSIARAAERDGYRMSSFILGVVQSDAFRMQRVQEVETEAAAGS